MVGKLSTIDLHSWEEVLGLSKNSSLPASDDYPCLNAQPEHAVKTVYGFAGHYLSNESGRLYIQRNSAIKGAPRGEYGWIKSP